MRHVVFLANLLFSFSLAITTYVNSSFIAEAVGTGAVGVVYIISALITIFMLARASKVVREMGNRKYFFFSAAIHVLSLLLLALPLGGFARIIGFVVYLISGTTLSVSFDIFFEHTAEKKNRGRTRGLYLALSNLGWVIGPLVTATLIDFFGYKGVYTISLCIVILFTVLLRLELYNYKDPAYTPHAARLSIHKAWNIPGIRMVVLSNFMLQIFYMWMIVYVPIYLTQNLGLTWDSIGLIFSVMLTAFVILDYPLGRLADKLGSEKELAAIGFLIMAASVFGFAFLPTITVGMVAFLMIISRIGAAMVETMTEVHFFKITTDSSPLLITLFRDLRPIATVVTPIVALSGFAFLGFRYSFAIFGMLMIAGFFFALGLERHRKWWKRDHKN